MVDENIASLLREKNILAVLNILRHERKTSRAEIARNTGLTPATVSNIVSRLENEGIVQIVGPGTSSGGRRPLLVEFEPEAFYLAGVDIGVYKVVVVIIDLHGTIIKRRIVELSPTKGKAVNLSAIIEAVGATLDSLGAAKCKVKGIGIGAPGIIDNERGAILWAPNLTGWQETPVAEIFHDAFGLYSFLEHDAKAMAIGEARLGAGRGRKDIFSIIIGRGIAGGIIVNGTLYRGHRSAAGEFGHITVNHSGPMCSCGNRGCLEVVAGGRAIASSAIRAVRESGDSLIMELVGGRVERITAKVVAEAAAKGDVLAMRIMDEAAEYIGIGLADVLNLISPELVVFGGGVSRAGDFFINRIQEVATGRAYTCKLSVPDFALSELGENAISVGAAVLVLERILDTSAPRKN